MKNAPITKSNESAGTGRANSTSMPLVHIRRGEAVTDSLAIAREFRRRHDNVMQTVAALIAEGTIGVLEVKETSYIDKWNRVQPCIELTERGALIAMPFIGGRNSRTGQVRLVDAFLVLRDQLAEKTSAAWVDTRKQAAASYRFMSQALEMARTDDGKNTGTYHYANEAKLLNWILTGQFSSMDRTDLPQPELALLEALEVRNAMLLARGVPYNERKQALPQYAEQWRMKRLAEPKLQRLKTFLIGGASVR
ncbi:Rha family transcriptional regulator [Paralcaligenes ureilyticus]|uniref:Rha family phage regulatory protein n=1 Tax=Paralcaligenes ureilyticus TaxID=627131 RepID=A0A4V2UZD9_9BURK|nr:Rha family transcriptional regulator [Paralcaligenes ureilyticus]TCT10958.1 Rha family phage regulatory protein [Paralcaligenes ureilyticus]